MLGLLALLAWAAADLAAAAWTALRSRPDLLQQLAAARPGAGAALQAAVDAESGLDSATLALLRHALPALPALLLGLLLGEGGTLVRRGPWGQGGAVGAGGGAAPCLPACSLANCPLSCHPPPLALLLQADMSLELSVPAVTMILL